MGRDRQLPPAGYATELTRGEDDGLWWYTYESWIKGGVLMINLLRAERAGPLAGKGAYVELCAQAGFSD